MYLISQYDIFSLRIMQNKNNLTLLLYHIYHRNLNTEIIQNFAGILKSIPNITINLLKITIIFKEALYVQLK